LIPATTPALAHVVLATQPAGALVYRTTQGEEALLCSTPCDVKVPASDEKETLTIRAPNYQDKHLEVRLSAHSQVALALNLDAKRRAKAKRKRRKGSASRPGQTGRGGAIPAALPRLRTHAPKDLPRLRTTTNP